MHEIKGYKIGRPEATNLRVLIPDDIEKCFIHEKP